MKKVSFTGLSLVLLLAEQVVQEEQQRNQLMSLHLPIKLK